MALKKAVYTVNQAKGTRGFEDLEVYQMALDVILNVHAVARAFPPEEKFDLTAQVQRSSKSVSSNIAEGYGRYHYLDSLRFYYIARGSLNETINHVITAKLLDYIDQACFEEQYTLMRRTERALNGCIQEEPYESLCQCRVRCPGDDA
jgi:four helix bundle protein